MYLDQPLKLGYLVFLFTDLSY